MYWSNLFVHIKTRKKRANVGVNAAMHWNTVKHKDAMSSLRVWKVWKRVDGVV